MAVVTAVSSGTEVCGVAAVSGEIVLSPATSVITIVVSRLTAVSSLTAEIPVTALSGSAETDSCVFGDSSVKSDSSFWNDSSDCSV